jgi:hypothetical protein
MIDVSVIIVSWNAREHLINCLDSLSNPDGYTQEVIVVDNGSTDGSCEATASHFPWVQLIRNDKNLGFSQANNIGMGHSSGRYLCLINSDVIVGRISIRHLVEFMDLHPEVGLAGPRLLNADGTVQYNCGRFPGIWNNLCQTLGLNYVFPKSAFFSEPFMTYWSHDENRSVDFITGAFWIIRKAALTDTGLLDEDFFFYAEDIDWCRRFHKKGWDVMLCSQAQAVHFREGSSKQAPIRFYLELHRADLLYWQKHHGWCGRVIYTWIVLLRNALRLVSGALVYLFRPSCRTEVTFKLGRNIACIRFIMGGVQKKRNGVRSLF